MDLKFYSWPLIAAFALATAWGQDFALSRRDYLLPGYLLASADVDGDGNPDLLMGDSSGLVVLRGQGDGLFGESVRTSQDISFPWWGAVVADFNRDGKADVIVGSYLFLGTADASFTSIPLKNPLFSANPYYSKMVVADFNEDGAADIAGFDGSEYRVLLSNGDGSFRRSFSVANVEISTVFGALQLRSYIVDINHDGHADLVLGPTAPVSPSLFRVFLGNGQGSFQEAAGLQFPLTAARIATMADFNGDGIADWILVSQEGGAYVAMGHEDGTFGALSMLPIKASTALAGDYNGDGRQDLVLGNALFLGSGDGTFLPPLRILPWGAIAQADWNHDGRLDLAASHDGVLSILLNKPLAAGERPIVTAESSAVSRALVSPGSFATLFGAGFSTGTEAAQTVSATLAGVQLRVRDAAGNTSPAELLYVSPEQINFRVPETAATGLAAIELAPSPQGAAPFVQIGIAFVEPAAPSLFQCNLSWSELIAVAETPEGDTYAQPAPCTDQQFRFPALVTFYGTGFNGADVNNTQVWVHGLPLKPLFVGPAGAVPGLDKIVIRVEATDLVQSEGDSLDVYASWVSITFKGLSTNGGYTGIY
jgi:uncharacterized protein (TIGR03437 family)